MPLDNLFIIYFACKTCLKCRTFDQGYYCCAATTIQYSISIFYCIWTYGNRLKEKIFNH